MNETLPVPPSCCLKLFGADTATNLELDYADDGIRAGFPSPAQDYVTESIDLNRELIQHPASTFYAKVVGDSMSDEGITEDDILVIDRALNPEHGDLAVCCLDGEFTLKRLRFLPGNRLILMPSNRKYKPIEITPEMDFSVWGIVLYTIKSNRRRRWGTEKW
jgi:DNA polymerase V